MSLADEDDAASDIVELYKKHSVSPASAIRMLSTAIGLVIARSENAWSEEGGRMVMEMARQTFLKERSRLNEDYCP